MSTKLDEKLALMDRMAGMRHRSGCTYDPSPWSNPDGDFCTCDLRERKAAVQEEIDRL